jgi:Ternary complex associated domain 9
MGMSVRSARSTITTQVPSLMTFTRDDVDRFDASASLLGPLEIECRRRGYLERATIKVPNLRELVRSWAERSRSIGLYEVTCNEQHGDLNPRNIILTGQDPQLIDFARFDKWPIGYDLSRLELQVFARVHSIADSRDYFAEEFQKWRYALTDVERGTVRERRSVYGLFQKSLVAWRESLWRSCGSGTPIDSLKRLYLLGRCYDTLRMSSYRDLSVFKRLFLLRVAVETAQRLGLVE